MANNSGMVRQPDVLGLVIRGTTTSAIARRGTALVDNERPLHVDLDRPRVDERGVDFGGGSGGPRPTGRNSYNSVGAGVGVGGRQIGSSVPDSARSLYRVGLVGPGRHCDGVMVGE
jgi:hypothetical protein